jgi:hypothetical protein
MPHGTDQAILGLGDGSVIGTGGNVADADNTLESIIEGSTVDIATDAELTAAVATHAALTQTVGVHGLPKVTLADGTGAGADVTVTGMVAADTLVSVLAMATKASIATMTDKTSEYVPKAGGLTKAAGTDETNNQLIIFWIDQV